MQILTRQSLHNSRPTISLFGADSVTQLPEPTYAAYLRQSLSTGTQRLYLADLKDFEAWGGSLPASPETIANYAAERAETLAVGTVIRRLGGLSKLHDAYGNENPVRTELVRATVRGIKRVKGIAQKQAAPLTKDLLFEVLARVGSRPKDVRDKALLLIGFAAALRRSEIVTLTAADLEPVRQGMILHLRRSKTDQEGVGRTIGIPHGRTRWCPVRALEDWQAIAEENNGPLFRRINRHSQIMPAAMKPEAVCLVVRERVAAIGLDPMKYSGHSLRAGLATSAAEAGVASWAIRRTTGHRSDQMLNRYIRLGDLFQHNAAGVVL
jgi:integrase